MTSTQLFLHSDGRVKHIKSITWLGFRVHDRRRIFKDVVEREPFIDLDRVELGAVLLLNLGDCHRTFGESYPQFLHQRLDPFAFYLRVRDIVLKKLDLLF